MAKVQDKELPVHEIPKGKTQAIFIRGIIAKGEPYLDIRTYYRDDDDEWAPTKKGVRLHAEFGDDLVAAVKAALEEIDNEVSVGVKR